jgi:hypothetical protein
VSRQATVVSPAGRDPTPLPLNATTAAQKQVTHPLLPRIVDIDVRACSPKKQLGTEQQSLPSAQCRTPQSDRALSRLAAALRIEDVFRPLWAHMVGG